MKSARFDVLFQDDALVAVNKPAGLLTIPDRYLVNEPNLRDLVSEAIGPVRVVHRIDRDTSGVVVLARTEAVHAAMNEAFESRAVEKVYFALCRGGVEEDEFVIDRPLRLDADRQHRTVVDAYRGKESLTAVHVVERFRGFTWVECRPETGRTHQIRVHLAESGLPIAADPLYGDGQPFYVSSVKPGFKLQADRDEQPILNRLALHAASIAFAHPLTGQKVAFEAPLPKDLRATLQQLRKRAPYRGPLTGLSEYE